jgi:hypothetical protein
MKRSGKSIVMHAPGMWTSDFAARNSKGKKTAWTKSTAKVATRGFRHDKSWKNDI